MRQITEVTRRDLFDVIQEGFVGKETVQHNTADYGYIEVEEDTHVYLPFYGRFTALEFLGRLYNLDDIPSTDKRFTNARGDIYCHTISFKDWPEFWFLEDKRFELMDGSEDEPILKFICEMLHPAIREENDPLKEYLKKFNELLKPDGYEIYASYRISGRDIYKARKYIEKYEAFDEDHLFTIRYRELIDVGNGIPVDNICGGVGYQIKKRLATIMNEFAEPTKIKPNRYDNYDITTDALRLAMERFNTVVGYPAINFNSDNLFGTSYEDQLINLFTPFLFDIIELQNNELSRLEKVDFLKAVNTIFEKYAVDFIFSDSGIIILQPRYEVLDNAIGENVGRIEEPGLRELLDEAIALYRQPSVSAHKAAVEKVWDALERLKTYYSSLDKKDSITKVINDISNGKAEYITLFNMEMKTLTDIGNNYRIRHHERNRVDINDARHYDYFFNRCLSLIALSIQYLH